jgi:hypothetical protein
MAMPFDVSVVGLYIVDVLGRPVEQIPPGGGVDFIEEIRMTVAGTAGGTAISCAHLDMNVRAVGAVGSDEKADFLVDSMGRAGIDTACVQRLSGVPTSATILNIRPNGERPALHCRGASDHFTVPDDQLDRVCDARFLHLGGTGLLKALDGEPSRRLLAAAKDRGCTTTFDLIAASAETLALVRPLLPYVDYFIPSVEEAQAMSGRDDPADMAAFFRDLGAGTCAITLGGEGSYVAGPDDAFRQPAFDVAVHDTTGCGDAYSAGFIAGLNRGFDLRTTARFAAAAASLVATGLGSDAGIESFRATERAMSALRELA